MMTKHRADDIAEKDCSQQDTETYANLPQRLLRTHHQDHFIIAQFYAIMRHRVLADRRMIPFLMNATINDLHNAILESWTVPTAQLISLFSNTNDTSFMRQFVLSACELPRLQHRLKRTIRSWISVPTIYTRRESLDRSRWSFRRKVHRPKVAYHGLEDFH